MTRPTHTRRAVTLLELLVTVAATILLTGILLVTIRGVRGQSFVMRDLNNLRLSAQDMLAWSVENDDKFLNIENPQSRLWTTAMPAGISSAERDFWSLYYSQSTDWNRLLGTATSRRHMHWQSAYGRPALPAGLEWAEDQYAELERTGNPELSVKLSRYQYSLAFVTRPELWENQPHALVPGDRIREWAKAVRTSETRTPSGKGLLINRLIPDDPHHAHIVFVDASAARIPLHDLAAPAIAPHLFTPAPGHPVLHTLMGYEGTDR